MGKSFKGWGICAATAVLIMLGGATWLHAGSPFSNSPKREPIMLIVMDPLAKELACSCVKGYAQRDYGRLAAKLEKDLKHRVIIDFSDNLGDSMAKVSAGQEVIVVAKRSVVVHGAAGAKLECRPIAELTGLDGSTTVSGIFVARSDDSAMALKDVAGRRIYFGPAADEDKHAAALDALKSAGLTAPAKPETRPTCSDGALDILDSRQSPPPVAVISSYALPLLEGCGSIKKGDLRVIGKTAPVPFVTVFVSENIPAAKQKQILNSLLGLKRDAKLLKAMESRDGFMPLEPPAPKPSTDRSATLDWPDWRGPGRDGHVPRLPERLPGTVKFIWKKAAMIGGLAGLSVSDGKLIVAERDFGEEHDVYRCLDASTGDLIWTVQFPARGQLDYGQYPRATPVIRNGRAYLLGAFGHLRCVSLGDGKVIWARHLPSEFNAELPTWGMCSTPLLVDDLLIVNPGATNASVVALDRATGRTRWTSPGDAAAYASFIMGEFGGRKQIVGYDQHSLGGWDPKTGERLWRLVPPTEGDFNVPTPIAVDGKLFVATENNGARLYAFEATGKIIPVPVGEYADLSPDTSTPVIAEGRVFGAHLGLHCLDVRHNLRAVWQRKNEKLGDYATIIADDKRVLVITLGGELILLSAGADDCAVLSRLRVFDDDVEVYSHPALVGTRLFIRGGSSIACVDLGAD